MDNSLNGRKKVVGFERAFEIVGGSGRHQWTLIAIISLQLIILTWNHLGYVFLGHVPGHNCKIDALANSTLTPHQIKEISLPVVTVSGKLKYDSCHYYEYNYTQVLDKLQQGYDFDTISKNLQNISRPIKKCDKWIYNQTLFSSTIPSQFDLVCDKRGLVATLQASYMLGGLSGNLIGGLISDNVLGRRRTALVSILIIIITGLIIPFANSYYVLIALRFLLGLGTTASMQSCNILVVESSNTAKRAFFNLFSGIFFGVGYAIMPLYAYFLRNWNDLQLEFALSSLALLSYFWILPDSARWLAATGRDEKALEELERIAKRNKMPKPDKVQLLEIIKSTQLKTSVENGQIVSQSKSKIVLGKLKDMTKSLGSIVGTKKLLKRSVILWMLFFTVAFVYYGFIFSVNLTTDPFLLVFIAGLIEIPSSLIANPFISSWGRKPTTVFLYIITGICSLIISAIPSSYEIPRVIFTMTGKFFVATAFCVVYVVGAEIYPTSVRASGLAIASDFGRIGSITSPYVVDLLTNVYQDLPNIIFGFLAISSGVCAFFFLPETKGKDIMDQVEDIELEKNNKRQLHQ